MTPNLSLSSSVCILSLPMALVAAKAATNADTTTPTPSQKLRDDEAQGKVQSVVCWSKEEEKYRVQNK